MSYQKIHNYIKNPQILLIICISLSCGQHVGYPNSKNPPTDTTKVIKSNSQKAIGTVPEYINSINTKSIEFPYVGNFTNTITKDTLKYEVLGNAENYSFIIYLNSDKKKAFKIKDATSFEAYPEGDLDGDGFDEIGILPGWNTSACRIYKIYSFKNNKWKELYRVDTHLPDRAVGVDYFKRDRNRLRIISAADNCCQCAGTDTTYINIPVKPIK